LTLASQVSLTEQELCMTQNMVLNSEITTASGTQLFCCTPSGIKVSKTASTASIFSKKPLQKQAAHALPCLLCRLMILKGANR
jgi:hypothetical protein